MKRKDILKDVVKYIFKTMGKKDATAIKKWRIKILSICLSAILLVSIIVTTVCVSIIHKENVVFSELKLPKEKTVEEYNAETYKNELEIKKLAGKQYFAIKLSLEKAEQLKQQAQRTRESAEQLKQEAQILLEKSQNNNLSASSKLEKAEENNKNAEQLKQEAIKSQQNAEKAQQQAQEAEKNAQNAREEAERKLKEANDIRIEKLEIQNMINKKIVKLNNPSIVDEKTITPTEVKQNIENDYKLSNQVKEKSKKIANFLTENNISYEKISNYQKTDSQKNILMKIKDQTDGKIERIENWNAQTQEEKEAKAYYMSKHLDANILREKFPNMIGRASDANRLTEQNAGSFDYEHRYNHWLPWYKGNSDNNKPYAYNFISTHSMPASLEKCSIDSNYIAIGKKMSDLKLMIGDWPWIDDTINVFMNNCEVLEYVSLNKIQHEAQSLSENDIEFLIKKEIKDYEYKGVLSWIIDDIGIKNIASDVKKTGFSISSKYLMGLFLSAGGKKILEKNKPNFVLNTIAKFGKVTFKTLINAKNFLLVDLATDMISSFCVTLYQKIKLSEIENSPTSVLDRLNSVFNVKIDSEKTRRIIKSLVASIQMVISVVAGPFSILLFMFSVVSILKQLLLASKMTYTIKPALDKFLQLLRSNPEHYSRIMYEKTKKWKTGIWYLIKTNHMKNIQDIDMEPRYQLEYLEDISDISGKEKAKAQQEGKSQLRECKWYEKMVEWTGLLNCQ